MGTQEGEFEAFVQRHWSGLLTLRPWSPAIGGPGKTYCNRP